VEPGAFQQFDGWVVKTALVGHGDSHTHRSAPLPLPLVATRRAEP
jgi:hypothetical protein